MYRNFLKTTVIALGTLLVSSTLVLASGVSNNVPVLDGKGMSSAETESRGTIMLASVKVGDTWCDGEGMYSYVCRPSPYPGSAPSCNIERVGSCPGGQSGPYWPAASSGRK
jgi:hypothetical protein